MDRSVRPTDGKLLSTKIFNPGLWLPTQRRQRATSNVNNAVDRAKRASDDDGDQDYDDGNDTTTCGSDSVLIFRSIFHLY